MSLERERDYKKKNQKYIYIYIWKCQGGNVSDHAYVKQSNDRYHFFSCLNNSGTRTLSSCSVSDPPTPPLTIYINRGSPWQKPSLEHFHPFDLLSSKLDLPLLHHTQKEAEQNRNPFPSFSISETEKRLSIESACTDYGYRD